MSNHTAAPAQARHPTLGAADVEIKAEASQDLNVCGADVAASAWRAGVIDECHVFVAPMLVGSGKRMFPDGLRQPPEQLDERRFGNGMVFRHHVVSP